MEILVKNLIWHFGDYSVNYILMISPLTAILKSNDILFVAIILAFTNYHLFLSNFLAVHMVHDKRIFTNYVSCHFRRPNV